MSNQPATFDFVTIGACLRIIWRFKYFFLHTIQPYHRAPADVNLRQKTSVQKWLQRLFMAFGTLFYLENHLEKLSKHCKKVWNWVSNMAQNQENLVLHFVYSLKFLTKNFHKSHVTKIALMEQVFSILYESKHQREASGSMASFNSS